MSVAATVKNEVMNYVFVFLFIWKDILQFKNDKYLDILNIYLEIYHNI